MAVLKFVLVFLAIAALCKATPSSRVDAHNLYVCMDYSNCHRVLYQEYVDIKGKLLQIVEHNVVYPSTIVPPIDKQQITCIEIQDLADNGKGGYYTITNGGLTQFFATVNLKSQRSQGLRFNVKFYTDVDCPE